MNVKLPQFPGLLSYNEAKSLNLNNFLKKDEFQKKQKHFISVFSLFEINFFFTSLNKDF
jgi:hypothetical protein